MTPITVPFNQSLKKFQAEVKDGKEGKTEVKNVFKVSGSDRTSMEGSVKNECLKDLL